MENTIDYDVLSHLKTDINESGNIYDIFAAACKAFGDYGVQKTSDYVVENYRELINIIAEFDQSCKYRPFPSFADLREKVMAWLISLENRAKITFHDVYALINNIDRIHCYEMPDTTFSKRKEEEHVIIIPALNNISLTTVRILPRLNETLTEKMNSACERETEQGFRKRGVGDSGDLNSELFNYYVHDVAKEKFTPIIHRFTKSDADIVSQRLNNKKKEKKGHFLTVGLFPLWGGNPNKTLNIKYTNNTSNNTYYIKEMVDCSEIKLQTRFIQAITQCEAKGVDIVIFPEMIMTRKILLAIIEHIKKIPAERLPVLMVMGSIWETSEEKGTLDKRNVSVVLSCWGEAVIEQRKLTPFCYEKPGHDYGSSNNPWHKEVLSGGDQSIHIIDIEGIGRFSTNICIDVKNSQLITLLKRLRVDVVLAPAFSRSRELKDELKSLTSGYWSIVLLCNSCSALYDTDDSWTWIPDEFIRKNIPNGSSPGSGRKYKEIGFVFTPAKRNDSQDVHPTSLYMSNSCLSCKTEGCPGRILDIYYEKILSDSKHSYMWIDASER